MKTVVDKGLEKGHESSGDLRSGSGLVLVRFCLWLEQMISTKSIKVVHPPLYNWLRFIPFYGWVVFHCIYVLHLLYPFICRWTFRLPCLGYCKQYCYEHGGTCVFLNCVFHRVYIPNSAISGSYGSFEALERGDQFRSVQFCSVAQLCPTLCDPTNHSMPGLPVHHHLQEFTQTQVHGVSDVIQPSHPLSSPFLLVPNPSQHQSFPMSQLFAERGDICM